MWGLRFASKYALERPLTFEQPVFFPGNERHGIWSARQLMTVVPATFAPGHPDYVWTTPKTGHRATAGSPSAKKVSAPRDPAKEWPHRASVRERDKGTAARSIEPSWDTLISMKISLLRQPTQAVQTPWLVLGIFEDDAEHPQVGHGTALDAIVARLIGEKELTGSLGELTALYALPGVEASAVLLVGLGPRRRFDAGAAFSAGFALAKRLAGKRREDVAVVLPPSDRSARHRFGTDRRGDRRHPRARRCARAKPCVIRSTTLSLVVGDDHHRASSSLNLEKSLRRGEIVGHAVNLARDLVNTPPAEKSPAQLADRIGLVCRRRRHRRGHLERCADQRAAIRRAARCRRGLG